MQVSSIDATDPLPVIVERLNELQPLLLQGYPSAVRRLAEEQLEGRLRIAPLSVTTSSEPLTASGRAHISEAFGVGVSRPVRFHRGPARGQRCPIIPPSCSRPTSASSSSWTPTTAPSLPGTPSAKVLVTNLFNRVQPLIRYELTDCFTRQPDADSDGHLRVTVEGRSDEELRWGSVVVHPIVMMTVMLETPAVSEYQVHQTRHGVDVACVADERFDADDLRARLAARLERAGVTEPQVTVRVVAAERLVRHPVTGKTRRFVPQ